MKISIDATQAAELRRAIDERISNLTGIRKKLEDAGLSTADVDWHLSILRGNDDVQGLFAMLVEDGAAWLFAPAAPDNAANGKEIPIPAPGGPTNVAEPPPVGGTAQAADASGGEAEAAEAAKKRGRPRKCRIPGPQGQKCAKHLGHQGACSDDQGTEWARVPFSVTIDATKMERQGVVQIEPAAGPSPESPAEVAESPAEPEPPAALEPTAEPAAQDQSDILTALIDVLPIIVRPPGAPAAVTDAELTAAISGYWEAGFRMVINGTARRGITRHRQADGTYAWVALSPDPLAFFYGIEDPETFDPVTVAPTLDRTQILDLARTLISPD